MLRDKLDNSTAAGAKQISGAPRHMRNDAALYEEDTMWYSNLALIAQARLWLRLNRGVGLQTFQRILLESQKAKYRGGQPQKANEFVANAVSTLTKVGVPQPLDHKPKSKHALRKIMHRVSEMLRREQVSELANKLPLKARAHSAIPGRCTASVLSKVMAPLPNGRYAERARMAKGCSHETQRAMTLIRHGLLKCAREKHKRDTSVSPLCPHCSTHTVSVVEDVEHVLLECRATRQTRRRILSRVHAQAQTNPQIRWATRGLSDDEIILATLGKPYHCRPGSKLHSALIGAAGPVWAREMKGLLY